MILCPGLQLHAHSLRARRLRLRADERLDARPERGSRLELSLAHGRAAQRARLGATAQLQVAADAVAAKHVLAGRCRRRIQALEADGAGQFLRNLRRLTRLAGSKLRGSRGDAGGERSLLGAAHSA